MHSERRRGELAFTGNSSSRGAGAGTLDNQWSETSFSPRTWCSCSWSPCWCSAPSGFPRLAGSSAAGCATSEPRSTGSTKSPRRSTRPTRSGRQTPRLSTSSPTRRLTAPSRPPCPRTNPRRPPPTATSSRTSLRRSPAATARRTAPSRTAGTSSRTRRPSPRTSGPTRSPEHEPVAAMSSARESAALVALLRLGRRPWREYADAVERAGSAIALLDAELADNHGQATLLPEPAAPLLTHAEAEIADWRRDGFELLTVLDGGYPENLRTVHDRPPLLFNCGRLAPQDTRSVAVVGARRATPAGLATAAHIAAIGRG